MSGFLPVLGTMATQNANAVAITGGTLAGLTSIISAAAAAGINFQTLSSTGSIVNDGTFDFPASYNYSLFAIFESQATGAGALCMSNGTAVVILGQTAGSFFTPTINTPASVNLYYNAGTIRIQNKRGGASTFQIINLRGAT